MARKSATVLVKLPPLPEGSMLLPVYRGRGKKCTIVGNTIIDIDMYGFLAQWRWFFDKQEYVVRYQAKTGMSVYMHRVILGLEYGDDREGDHKNRNKRDNRKSNLRITNRATNQQNFPAIGGTSKYRGVCWDKKSCKWKAAASLKNKVVHIGLFTDEEEAAEAARKWRLENMVGALD